MLRDDHSDYKWFFAYADTTVENVALAIIYWLTAFSVPNGLISNGTTHFKNETVRLVCRELKVSPHFILSYCLWSNGAVERLGKELLRVFWSRLFKLMMEKTK